MADPALTSVAVAAGAAAGGTPPSPTLDNYASDERLVIKFGTGTSATTGTILTVTPGTSWNAAQGPLTPPAVMLTPQNAATALLLLAATPAYTNGQLKITITNTVAPSSSQSVGTYIVALDVSGA